MKMAAGRPTVSLREITADSVRAIVRLSISEPQEDLVADNGCSIAQAHFDEKAWMRGIYADETPVGFVMLWIDRNKPEYYLWRFMIDEAHQGSGFGRRAMQLLIAWVRAEPNATEFTLHVMDRANSARAFYESLGFEATGEVENEEIVMRLEL